MAQITFYRATTAEERLAINTFLVRHNQRGKGSTNGYIAYYAAAWPPDGRPLLDRLVAVAKVCPVHTPQAGAFFTGKPWNTDDEWKHVYCLQRLAAFQAPKNTLSRFIGWMLREINQDERIHYVCSYADRSTINPNTGEPHTGAIYRATNATYCGITNGGRTEGFWQDGVRHSMRCGHRTWTVTQLQDLNRQARVAGKPEPIKLIRSIGMYRYCWATGRPLARRFRRVALLWRMRSYTFDSIEQTRLFARVRSFVCTCFSLASRMLKFMPSC